MKHFLDLDLPTTFVLEVPTSEGGWVDYGRYRAGDFDRLADGTYVCAGGSGSPLFLRCVHQTGDVITCVDGGGEQWVGRLAAFDDGY